MVVVFGAMKDQEQQQAFDGLPNPFSIGLNATSDAME